MRQAAPSSGHVLSVPVWLGFLSSKQQCLVLRSQGTLPPGPPLLLPQPRASLSGRRCASSSRPAAPPCPGPPWPGSPGSPPTASWPRLLRTPRPVHPSNHPGAPQVRAPQDFAQGAHSGQQAPDPARVRTPGGQLARSPPGGYLNSVKWGTGSLCKLPLSFS